jgi:hypothetical protein
LIFIYNYTIRSTIISWSISLTTSALKDHTPLEAVPPELTEKEVNLLGDVEEGDKDETVDVYGKQLASVKASKIQTAQALLDKANGNGKVIKNLKEGLGEGQGTWPWQTCQRYIQGDPKPESGTLFSFSLQHLPQNAAGAQVDFGPDLCDQGDQGI